MLHVDKYGLQKHGYLAIGTGIEYEQYMPYLYWRAFSIESLAVAYI